MPKVDLVFVGVGFTAAVVARELKDASIKMVGLERGRARNTVPDFQSPAMHDELGYAVRHGLMQDVAKETVTVRNRSDQTALPYRQIGSFLPGTDLGGAGVHWNGQTWRFQEADFRLRSHHEERYGRDFVPGELTIQDWGLTYQDLEPFYDRFERVLGIGGYAGNINGEIRPGGNPFEAPHNGNQGGATACSQCHGLDGAALAAAGAFPRVAGQPAYYLYKQLNDYASGARENPIMGPIAQTMSDADRQNAAAYYASLDRSPYPETEAADPKVLELGARLSVIGSSDNRLRACANCHGPAGVGEAPAFPQLAGQFAYYAQSQLQAPREKSRHNDVAAVMREISSKMSDDEMAAVSAYLEAVRPARDARPAARRSARADAR